MSFVGGSWCCWVEVFVIFRATEAGIVRVLSRLTAGLDNSVQLLYGYCISIALNWKLQL